ncbi:acyltransferase family protein [Chitinophaga sp. SYP-B3965]|uniref:acyltransferase family protein n=1 Tax=Chitinophaga sp. SYP-B3965 TaxID=2663120 RepID=UPI001299EB95|nr:acyltransferase [Chitinophaga sp. SYP-B3965]MRG48326.1 acyltransferase family protein [Chitinophaga sp. SYP-B3965]
MEHSTSQNGKLAGLDHLRALAIIAVLFYHYRMFKHPEWLDKIMGFGWTGVDLFFVLSGYLISSQLFASIAAGKPISLPEFFIKRFFRIIPAYLVVLAIYFLIPAFHEKEALPPLWKFLTFTQNFGFDIKNFGTFSHVWSLCVEEHFYLLFPLVLFFNPTKRGGLLLLGVLILGFIARLFTWYTLVAPEIGSETFGITWYKHIYYPTYNRLDGLLAGVSIAALFTFRPLVKERITKYGNVILVLGILVLTAAWFLCEDQKTFSASIFGFPLVSAGFGLLVVAALSPNCILYKYNSRFTALIAKLSFGLYLIHKGVIHLIQPLFAEMGFAPKGNLMFLMCLIGAVIAALILNKTVEAPFLRLRSKLLAKSPVTHTDQLSKIPQ